MDDLKDSERRRILSYRQVFNSPAGKEVLRDLEQRYLYGNPVAIHLANNNAIAAHGASMQQAVILTIQSWLTVDLDEYLKKFDLDDMEAQGDPYGGSERTYTPRAVSREQSFIPRLDSAHPAGVTKGTSLATGRGQAPVGGLEAIQQRSNEVGKID